MLFVILTRLKLLTSKSNKCGMQIQHHRDLHHNVYDGQSLVTSKGDLQRYSNCIGLSIFVSQNNSKESNMTLTRTEQIRNYLKTVIDYLDGNGLVITDPEIIDEVLSDFDDFDVLRSIVTGTQMEYADYTKWMEIHAIELSIVSNDVSHVLNRMRLAELVEEYQDLFNRTLLEDWRNYETV